jgi:CHASE3 domain sensor protein
MSENKGWFDDSVEQYNSREEKRQQRKEAESQAFAVFGQIVAWTVGIGIFLLVVLAMFRLMLWIISGI